MRNRDVVLPKAGTVQNATLLINIVFLECLLLE